MPDPFDDVSWSDLAAELGVETPQVEKPPPLPPTDDAPPEDLSTTLFDDSLPDASEPGADTEVIELGGPDGEKKRRRRRRRKKKGDPGEATEVELDDEAPANVEEGLAQPSELLRDILKNWDVPGWEDIVTGLYRPHR